MTNGHHAARDTAAPDPELPMLTAAQATRLRQLAAPHMEEGHTYSLRNLAQRCANAPEERWPELAAAHFTALANASGGGEDADALLRSTYPGLLPAEALPPDLADAMRYAPGVADGLVLAYVLDGPTSVRILTDADLARVGPEELNAAAFANLRRLPVTHEEVPLESGASVHSVYGDEPFVAGKALELSDLARQLTGQPLPDAGALVVVPTRHLLAFHPIADGSVVDALNGLAAYALGAYEDGPGSLSPRVYWWHGDGLTSLTAIDDDTRVLSLRPPPELLGRMRGLTALDRAGRLATRTAAGTPPDTAALTRTLTSTLAASLARLAREPEPTALPDAFGAAVTLALARCADDPDADSVDTWDPWALAVQLGAALFTGAESQECRLGEDGLWRMPDVPAQPPADARAWLDAFYVNVVCRRLDRLDRLCQVPLEALRQDESVDAYVLHWIDTLQTFWTRRPVDEVVRKLTATMETSLPGAVTHAPQDFVGMIDTEPAALFHRLLTRDHDAFTEALAKALTGHRTYWRDAAGAPRAQVALGPLAMASMAYDFGFPVAERQPYLPTYLLDGKRIEVIPG